MVKINFNLKFFIEENIYQESMNIVKSQMNSFLNFFLEDDRKPRSIKRSFIGRCMGSFSCSGSRERKNKRVFTPTNKKLEISLRNLKGSKGSINDSGSSYRSIKQPRQTNKAIERRHIVLYSKERSHSNNGSSGRIITTTVSTKSKKKKMRKEINLGVNREHLMSSEKDNYSLGLSTQNQQVMFRTLDDDH